MAVLWDVTLCILAEIDRHLKSAYCFCHQGYKFHLKLNENHVVKLILHYTN